MEDGGILYFFVVLISSFDNICNYTPYILIVSSATDGQDGRIICTYVLHTEE